MYFTVYFTRTRGGVAPSAFLHTNDSSTPIDTPVVDPATVLPPIPAVNPPPPLSTLTSFTVEGVEKHRPMNWTLSFWSRMAANGSTNDEAWGVEQEAEEAEAAEAVEARLPLLLLAVAVVALVALVVLVVVTTRVSSKGGTYSTVCHMRWQDPPPRSNLEVASLGFTCA